MKEPIAEGFWVSLGTQNLLWYWGRYPSNTASNQRGLKTRAEAAKATWEAAAKLRIAANRGSQRPPDVRAILRQARTKAGRSR